uniref:hypothetical protein n=1 Tax=Timspurckia oligopyrenoides TaxID=708627 RepID=UPI001FCD70E9|nr:hypothetical protein MW591_pgp154 [Timspurckia oligopyrenoides]UNJ17461.1 hypothetical protein [Timspurckia oligopyrenoides]
MSVLISTLNLVFISVARFTELYVVLILIRLSLGWLPNLNTYNEPYYTLYRLTDPYLKLFRGIVPYIFGMDLSPILAILFLQNLMVIFQNIHLESLN